MGNTANESYNFSDDNTYNSLDQCLNDSYTLFHTRKDHSKIVVNNLIPYTTATVNTSMEKSRPVNVQVLLNSGDSGTIMHQSLAKKLRVIENKKITWHTLAGKVSTANVARVQF